MRKSVVSMLCAALALTGCAGAGPDPQPGTTTPAVAEATDAATATPAADLPAGFEMLTESGPLVWVSPDQTWAVEYLAEGWTFGYHPRVDSDQCAVFTAEDVAAAGFGEVTVEGTGGLGCQRHSEDFNVAVHVYPGNDPALWKDSKNFRELTVADSPAWFAWNCQYTELGVQTGITDSGQTRGLTLRTNGECGGDEETLDHLTALAEIVFAKVPARP